MDEHLIFLRVSGFGENNIFSENSFMDRDVAWCANFSFTLRDRCDLDIPQNDPKLALAGDRVSTESGSDRIKGQRWMVDPPRYRAGY